MHIDLIENAHVETLMLLEDSEFYNDEEFAAFQIIFKLLYSAQKSEDVANHAQVNESRQILIFKIIINVLKNLIGESESCIQNCMSIFII